MKAHVAGKLYRNGISNLGIAWHIPVPNACGWVSGPTTPACGTRPLEKIPIGKHLETCPLTNRQDSRLQIVNVVIRQRGRSDGGTIRAPFFGQHPLSKLLGLHVLRNFAVVRYHVFELLPNSRCMVRIFLLGQLSPLTHNFARKRRPQTTLKCVLRRKAIFGHWLFCIVARVSKVAEQFDNRRIPSEWLGKQTISNSRWLDKRVLILNCIWHD